MSNAFIPVLLSALTAFGIYGPGSSSPADDAPKPAEHRPTDTTKDTTGTATKDSVKFPPLYEQALRYGMDTTVSPCFNFYDYVNGGWRAQAVFPSDSTKSAQLPPKIQDAFRDASERAERRLQALLDSARTITATTTDPTWKVLGTFYTSCLTADSLERVPFRSARSNQPKVDSTREQQCLRRTMTRLGGALGQVFALDVVTPASRPRMQHVLDEVKKAVEIRLNANKWMSASEKELAIDRLHKMVLRVGIPDQLVDYSELNLSPSHYEENKLAIANFDNRQWVNSIGGNLREKWKASLFNPNAFYSSMDHAIEVPALMFYPPFFEADGEDVRNFAGIGMVIGHEIFHGISAQLATVENVELKEQIKRLKAQYSGLGTVDGWGTNGERTFNEDVADIGGAQVALEAWKTMARESKHAPQAKVEGFTPEQRYFISLGRVWRSKWRGGAAFNRDVHSPPFARINGIVMQMPEFAKAFGCKEGDPMVLSAEKKAVIW